MFIVLRLSNCIPNLSHVLMIEFFPVFERVATIHNKTMNSLFLRCIFSLHEIFNSYFILLWLVKPEITLLRCTYLGFNKFVLPFKKCLGFFITGNFISKFLRFWNHPRRGVLKDIMSQKPRSIR